MQYSVRAAAIATGVAEARLRTWERRYGIPSPERSATGRRLYSEADLALIRRMAALVDAGVPAAQAADALLSGAAPETPAPVAASARHPATARLFDATEAFDEAGFLEALWNLVTTEGWSASFDQAVMPLLREVGAAWERGELSLAHEHFASSLLTHELGGHLTRLALAQVQPVLLACPGDERHELPLLALAVALREAGAGILYLGADVPHTEILVAARSVDAAAVCLVATAPAALPSAGEAARGLIAGGWRRPLFAGGAALAGEGGDTIPALRLPEGFAAAAEHIRARLGRAAAEATGN